MRDWGAMGNTHRLCGNGRFKHQALHKLWVLTCATVVQADASWMQGHTGGWKSFEPKKVVSREGFQRLGAHLPMKKTFVSSNENNIEEYHVGG